MKYFEKLKGSNVFLSPIDSEDFEIYCGWINDLYTSSSLGNASKVYGLIKEKEVLEELSKEGQNFAIVRIEDRKLLGNSSLFSINHIHRTAELGLFIGDKENRNKGYGTEAMELLISYGFKVLNLNNIMLRVFSFNEGAIKSYIKVGFKEFGRRTDSYYINDRYYDEIYMQIIKNDFKSELLMSGLQF